MKKKKILGIELSENIRFLLKQYVENSEYFFEHIPLTEYNPRSLITFGDIFLIAIEEDSLL